MRDAEDKSILAQCVQAIEMDDPFFHAKQTSILRHDFCQHENRCEKIGCHFQ
jgi:hypothetical protein